MQHYEESHLILSPALTREEEQRQRRLQARRESRRSRLEQETPQQRQARLAAVREPVALCSGGSSWSPLLLISSWSKGSRFASGSSSVGKCSGTP